VRYVIVGNSAAAVGAVEGLRSIDREGSVTLVAAEREHAYSRPLISYLLAGKVAAELMNYRPADFYLRHRVQAHLGEEVVAVDVARRAVTARSGRQFAYDRLLLATGGRAIVPDLPGLQAKGVFTFTTWNDARAIEAALAERRLTEAVVLGGGLIGLKAAEALMARGLKVTIVELADHLLSAALDRAASEIVEQALRRRAAAVCLQTTIDKVLTSAGAVRGVHLASGHTIYCQMLVVAVGVEPNVEYLRSSGLVLGRGVVVDEFMRTSAPDVYAAGDLAEAQDLLAGRKRPIPILPLAYRQGLIAGRNMAGAQETYRGGLAMNAIEICDVPTIAVGLTTAPEADGYETLTQSDPAGGPDARNSPGAPGRARAYRKVVLQGGRIVGALFVGDIDRAGIYTGLIERRVDVSAIRHLLLSKEFGLLALDPEYRKHVVNGPGIEV
jgi:NAD(P)H-nitrite reductase large subunit